MSEKNGYKVLLLSIVNNRLIRAFKSRLNGGHLEIAGKTGTGKTTGSSILWEIITPGNDRITHGEKKSTITAILSDGDNQITAVRNYLPSGGNVSITKQYANEDGIFETKSITAKDFKAMLSPLSSNPHEIKKLPSKDKVALFLTSAGIPTESYEAADDTIAVAAKALGLAQAHRKDSVPGDEPEKADPVGAEALSDQIAGINDHNARCDRWDATLAGKLKDLTDVEESVDNEDAKLSEYQEEIKNHQTEIDSLKESIIHANELKTSLLNRVDALKLAHEEAVEKVKTIERIPQEDISKAVNVAAELNQIATVHQQWVDRVKADSLASEILGKAQKAHKAALKAKKLIMDGAELPLDGLTINDGVLWYKDILVDNLGESKQMLVYGSLAIEDALQHAIRAVRMDGIESMGQEDYIQLRDLATEKGVQLFTTRVTWDDEIQDTEILIVDGYFPEKKEEE